MYTAPIKVSSTPGEIPTTEQLGIGEIAINTADRAIYTKDKDDGVVSIIGNDVSELQEPFIELSTNLIATQRELVEVATELDITEDVDRAYTFGQVVTTPKRITQSFTIPINSNALCIGPATTEPGVTITVPPGCTLVTV